MAVRVRYLITILLAIAPLLRVYEGLPGMDMAQVFLVAGLFLAFASRNINFEANNEFLFVIGLFFISFVNYTANFNTIWYSEVLFFHNLFTIILFSLFLVFLVRLTEIPILLKTTQLFGCLASIVCLYQYYSLLINGVFLSDLFIPGLKVARDLESFSVVRPSSFFTEPAHLAIFLLPIYYISLLKKNLLYIIITMLGIICSGSTTGFVIIGVITLEWICNMEKRRKGKIKLILIVLAVVISVSYFFGEAIINNYEKLSSVEGTDGRMLGSLVFVRYFNFVNYCFGVGLNQLENFRSFLGLFIPGEGVVNYANSIVYIFLCYGLLGGVVLFLYLYVLFRKTKKNFGFFIILVGVLASDQVLFNINLLYVLMFAVLSNKICVYAKS